jgi:hypothetical protein
MKQFAVINDVTGEKVFVVRGEIGFYPKGDPAQSRQWSSAEAWVARWDAMRATQTDDETMAAKVGSMFGWDCPGAKAAAEDQPIQLPQDTAAVEASGDTLKA